MLNTRYLSAFSMTCFLINFTLSQLILTLPTEFSLVAGTGVNFLNLYIFGIIILINIITSKLYTKFIGIGLFSIATFLGGKVLKEIVNILYSVVFITITVIYLREVSEAIKTLLFNSIAIPYINGFFIISMVIGSILGLEAIIRCSSYLCPISIICIILTILFTIPFFNIDNIYPILGNGTKDILLKGFPKIIAYLGFAYLFLFAKYVKKKKEMNKISYSYIFVSFILLAITLTADLLILSYPYSSTKIYALYEIAKLTNLNPFFQRSEIIYIFSLLIIAFIFLISVFYGTIYCIKDTFSKKNLNIWVVLLIALGIYIASNLLQNIVIVETFLNSFNTWLIIPVIFFLPIILLILANIKAKKNRGAYEKFIAANS